MPSKSAQKDHHPQGNKREPTACVHVSCGADGEIAQEGDRQHLPMQPPPLLGHRWSHWHHTTILIPGFLQTSWILEPGRIQTVGTPPQSPCWKWISSQCTWGRKSKRESLPASPSLHHHTLRAGPCARQPSQDQGKGPLTEGR